MLCAKLISYIISLNPHALWFGLSTPFADEETETQRRSVICKWQSQDSKPETLLQPKLDFVDSVNMGLRLLFVKLGWVAWSRMHLFIHKCFTWCLVPGSVVPFFFLIRLYPPRLQPTFLAISSSSPLLYILFSTAGQWSTSGMRSSVPHRPYFILFNIVERLL